MTTCYLGLGSNLGDRSAMLHWAVCEIVRAVGPVTRLSNVYASSPWGHTTVETSPYLNAALACETRLSPKQLLAAVLAIEHAAGRRRTVTNAPRKLDIDVLFYGSETRQTPALTLPHPRLHLRKFVLVPLQEIAPNLRHPQLGATVEELLRMCRDELAVELYSPSEATGDV